MTNTIILLAIILVNSTFIGLIMETYKKLIRNDKSSTIENRIIAFLLSVVFGFLTYEVVDLSEITSLVRDSLWVSLAYGILIYVGQYQSCMNFWKPLVKKWIRNKVDE